MEMNLRHLAAHVYEQRTHDSAGASNMRAVCAPGTSRDIAPSWLVSEATTFSKSEHQRTERVSGEAKRRAKGTTEPKGAGKGKDKKGKGKE